MTLLTFNLESIYPIQIAMTTNTERTWFHISIYPRWRDISSRIIQYRKYH
jgi:hypothetical protein